MSVKEDMLKVVLEGLKGKNVTVAYEGKNDSRIYGKLRYFAYSRWYEVVYHDFLCGFKLPKVDSILVLPETACIFLKENQNDI